MNRATFANLYNRLQRSKTRYTECVKIVREDGTEFRFTAHDKPLYIWERDGQRYEYVAANSFEITAIENSAGLAVSNMDINALITNDSITEDELRAGLYERARVEMFLAYWSNSRVQTLPLRTSWIGELQTKGTSFRADLRGISQLLAQMFVEQTSLECRATFCDTRCGLDVADYTLSYTVTTKISQSVFIANIAGNDHGTYEFGLATFTGGLNNGLTMEVLHNWTTKIELFLPMPYAIEIGDTLTLVKGCDKRRTTCIEFENFTRFVGEPFLAGSDVLMRYPSQTVPEEDGEENFFSDLNGGGDGSITNATTPEVGTAEPAEPD